MMKYVIIFGMGIFLSQTLLSQLPLRRTLLVSNTICDGHNCTAKIYNATPQVQSCNIRFVMKIKNNLEDFRFIKSVPLEVELNSRFGRNISFDMSSLKKIGDETNDMSWHFVEAEGGVSGQCNVMDSYDVRPIKANDMKQSFTLKSKNRNIVYELPVDVNPYRLIFDADVPVQFRLFENRHDLDSGRFAIKKDLEVDSMIIFDNLIYTPKTKGTIYILFKPLGEDPGNAWIKIYKTLKVSKFKDISLQKKKKFLRRSMLIQGKISESLKKMYVYFFNKQSEIEKITSIPIAVNMRVNKKISFSKKHKNAHIVGFDKYGDLVSFQEFELKD